MNNWSNMSLIDSGICHEIPWYIFLHTIGVWDSYYILIFDLNDMSFINDVDLCDDVFSPKPCTFSGPLNFEKINLKWSIGTTYYKYPKSNFNSLTSIKNNIEKFVSNIFEKQIEYDLMGKNYDY